MMVVATLMTLLSTSQGTGAAVTQMQPAALTYVDSWTESLHSPARLSIAPDGTALVTDPFNNYVVHFDANGNPLDTWPVAEGPIGVAAHADGRYFVSLRDQAKVAIYDSSFTRTGFLGEGNPMVTFVRPTDLDIAADTGNIYVVDSGGERVYGFAPDGSVATIFGTRGGGNGAFRYPSAIAVDEARNRLVVADHDNFRVQIFTRGGGFITRFGERNKYPVGGTAEGWTPRTQGVAVDAQGRIYLADAMMSTVRQFDSNGVEIAKLLVYGTTPGNLRTPCDLALSSDGLTLYVISTNTSSVNLYAVTASSPSTRPGLPPGTLSATGGTQGSRIPPSDPRPPWGDIPEGGDGLGRSVWEGPHIIESPIVCGRCHGIRSQPGGHEGLVEGQAALCMSCHTAGGQAMQKPVHEAEIDFAHPWGVPASAPGVPGPAPGSDLALHLDNGDIRCGTCHSGHESAFDDSEYLRGSIRDGGLCAQCHTQVAEWQNAGHADTHADAWGHYDWSQPNRAACRRCHSGSGYIDFTKDIPEAQRRGEFRVLDCTVCHSAHDKPQAHDLLRLYDTVTLPADGPDVTLTDVGPMATCMACHNGRVAPEDPGITPHYALGGVMLEGINGISFGYTLFNSPHSTLANCIDCHMAPTPAPGQPGSGKIGGHTFSMKVKDPTDPDFGVENLAGCNASNCHGTTARSPDLLITTLNRTALGDYDGDGAIEGVQDETRGLMDLVLAQITARGAVQLSGYPYWNTSGVAPADLTLVQDAIWNWQFVQNSGDFGVHNTAYAVGLLQVTYRVLAGQDVPNAFLRYGTAVASYSDVAVEITEVNGGAPVQPGGPPLAVNFTVEDENGDPIPKSALDRLRIYVSGPLTNFQRVIPQDGTLSRFVQNPDGTYTYTAPSAFPTVYLAPVNDSPAFGPADGELTGLPLMDGTYRVLIEARQLFGSVRKVGDATFDFVVANDAMNPPAPISREIVRRETCNQCHNDLQIHGGGRKSVAGCVICHNAGAEDIITNPESTPGLTIDFHDMIHRLHQGIDLPRVAATANSADPYYYEIAGFGGNLIDFSLVGFPIIPSAAMDCTACHQGAADGGRSYTTITRKRCSTCHDDINFVTGTVLDQSNPAVSDGLLTQADLDNPAYRTMPGGVTHAFIDDTTCNGCHGPGMDWEVEALHQHPTNPAQEGTEPAIDIVSVTGMTGGGGTYFQAGDRPQITFRLSNSTTDPLQLVPGDRAIADRIEFIIAGPTTLYQTIIPLQRPWNSGNLATAGANWVDNFAVDGTYTFISSALPANYPAQLNSIGEPPGDQLFPFAGGWGQLYTPAGTPLDAGTYTVFGYGRRVTPVAAEREPMFSDTHDFVFGAGAAMTPYSETVTTTNCNACHGNLAFHGNAREGVKTCLACHTAGTQDGGTAESVDFRIMLHKLHNARNLDVVTSGGAYELNGNSGIADFSHLLISAMPGEAAECQVCHATDAWKSPPMRENMRTWMVVCTSCHDSAETAAHVQAGTLFGTFVETCVYCHGDGAAWSVERMHKTP